MWLLLVCELLFLGTASEEKLIQAGIKTIGELACSEERRIQHLLGDKAGRQLRLYANGIDDSPIQGEREEAKGYGAETTVEEDLVTYEQTFSVLLAQCDVVSARMRRDGKMRQRSDNLSDAGFQNKIAPEITCKSYGCYEGDLCTGEKTLGEAARHITEEGYPKTNDIRDQILKNGDIFIYKNT